MSRWLSLVLVLVVPLGVASAQEQAEADHHEGLHFSHPLIAESVSPDTEVRLDYAFADLGPDASAQALGLELEYAFHRAFSIEAGIPFARLDVDGEPGTSRFGNAEVAFKFANYAFEDTGALLGYGVEFGLPTGSDSGTTLGPYVRPLEAIPCTRWSHRPSIYRMTAGSALQLDGGIGP